MIVVPIDGALLKDEASFHAVFAEIFGFPDAYGKNMDAWIDCMTSLDDPDVELTAVHVAPGELLTLAVGDAKKIPRDLLSKLSDAAAFVNYRRMLRDEPPVLVLSYAA